jgi:sugar (pentulose or hexulose) kinase
VSVEVALGVDVGTSGVRIAAVDEAGDVRAMAAASLPSPLLHDGHVRQDPLIWWDATSDALTRLDITGLRVRVIAVDGTSGTILGIDADGTPTGQASMYADVAGDAAVASVAAVAPRETAALGRTSPLARALGICGSAAARAREVRVRRVVHQADWIAGRFSGRYDVTDENNALKSGYDPVARVWPTWIAATGIDRDCLPDVVPAGRAIGPIQSGVATRFGLPGDVTVVAGTTDGCAAFLASGASQPGDGVTSLGTTLTVKLLSAHPVFAPECGIYSHRIGDQWLAGGASNSGGAVIAAHFSRDDLARLTPLLVSGEPTGLDYYPLLTPGERFPVNDPTLAPRLTPRPDDDRLFLQGLLEGIAAIEAQGYRMLAALGASRLTSIRTTGGGAANEAWTAMRARTLGVTVCAARSEHAAVGTARLAWWGIGHAC